MLSELDSSRLAWDTNLRYTRDTPTLGSVSESEHKPSKEKLGARKRRTTPGKILRVKR
jgi:hypothetical protein